MGEREHSVTTGGIDRVLEFLPLLEAATRELHSWLQDSGDPLSGPISSDQVVAFEQALYEEGFVVPFDWVEWQPIAERLTGHPALLADADVATLQKLLTTHIRKERFCAGHLGSVLANGHIVAVLRRLQAIRKTLNDSG